MECKPHTDRTTLVACGILLCHLRHFKISTSEDDSISTENKQRNKRWYLCKIGSQSKASKTEPCCPVKPSSHIQAQLTTINRQVSAIGNVTGRCSKISHHESHIIVSEGQELLKG